MSLVQDTFSRRSSLQRDSGRVTTRHLTLPPTPIFSRPSSLQQDSGRASLDRGRVALVTGDVVSDMVRCNWARGGRRGMDSGCRVWVGVAARGRVR